MKIRTTRTIAIVASAALLLGAFVAGPAEAKKKKKKKAAPAACAPYAPGEKGAGQPVTVVTDAATAEAPVTATVATSPGLGFSSEAGEGNPDEIASSHAYTNVQVDSATPGTGLYVIIEFTPAFDYDLHLRDAAGTSIEYSAGFGPVPSGTEHSHSNVGSESLEGLPVGDCQGFTVDVVGATTPGEDVTVKYYLGEAV
jgi:hypothetical protein